MIDAAEALRIGLVDKIVPHDALAAEVSALAEGIARQARCAVQQTKRCIRHGLESGLESGLSYEAQAFGLCFSTRIRRTGGRLRQSPPLIGLAPQPSKDGQNGSNALATP